MEQTTPVTVRVQWHANGGFTRVEDAQGRHWEIPTQAVPADLRQIGSQFILLIKPGKPGELDSPEAIHRTFANIHSDIVQRLP